MMCHDQPVKVGPNSSRRLQIDLFLGGNTVNSRNASVDTDKPFKILADKVLYFVKHPLLFNTVTETSPLFLRKSSVVVRSLVW